MTVFVEQTLTLPESANYMLKERERKQIAQHQHVHCLTCATNMCVLRKLNKGVEVAMLGDRAAPPIPPLANSGQKALLYQAHSTGEVTNRLVKGRKYF